MPGRQITKPQVEIYMTTRQKGCTQATAAAKADISERSGRNIEHGRRKDPKQTPRHWRTRTNPLEAVWQSELVPMLEGSPGLQPITLLEYLQAKQPEQYPDSILRTLQRRVKAWRAKYGPEKEVIFMQTHEAGRQGLSDFTHLNETTITVAGQAYPHLLYHFRLAFSHWSHMKVIEGGESYTALAEGLQEALQRLGGAPKEHRTDSLSAAFKNISPAAQEDITARYNAFCQTYNMQATRNNRGVAHENGSVESAHGHLKRRIKQALLLRGSHDFKDVGAYQAFIDTVVQQHNRRNAKAIQIEREALQSLSVDPGVDYTQLSAVVSCASTIEIKRVLYTVPSRLQGETLQVRLYHDRLACYLGQHAIVMLKRVHPSGNHRARQVDYRHVIGSLVKKPQAFRYSRLREDLLPNAQYRFIWSSVDRAMPPKRACKFMVGLLHLAARQDCEEALGEWVVKQLEDQQPLVLSQLQEQFRREKNVPPTIEVDQHALSHYNQLIPEGVQYA